MAMRVDEEARLAALFFVQDDARREDNEDSGEQEHTATAGATGGGADGACAGVYREGEEVEQEHEQEHEHVMRLQLVGGTGRRGGKGMRRSRRRRFSATARRPMTLRVRGGWWSAAAGRTVLTLTALRTRREGTAEVGGGCCEQRDNAEVLPPRLQEQGKEVGSTDGSR